MRGIILIVPFSRLKRYMGVYNKESSFVIDNSQYNTVKKIAWAVDKASKFTPWKSKCLVQALTAQRMLKSRHIYSTLYLGVAKKEDCNLAAHAWLRCGSMIVTGGYVMNDFKQVAKFSNEKQIVKC